MLNTGGLDANNFVPQEKKPQEAELTPQEKEQQAIAKSVAGIQYSSIYPDLQQRYAEKEQDYIQFQIDAYKRNRGREFFTGRPTLNFQDAIESSKRQRDLMESVKWGTNIEKRLEQVGTQYLGMVKETRPNQLTTTAEDYQDWLKGYMGNIKKGGDVEDPVASFTNYVSEKNRRVPESEKDKLSLDRSKRQERSGIQKTYLDKEKDFLTGLNKEHYTKDPASAIRERANEMFPNQQSKDDFVSDAKDAGYLDKDVSTDEGLDILSKTRLRAKETTKSVPSGITFGTTQTPTTFSTFEPDNAGGSSVDLSGQHPEIKGNFGGKDVDGVVDRVGVDENGNKYAEVKQDKMIKGKGASRGKMVSSGEKEIVRIPYNQTIEKALKDKKVNIAWDKAQTGTAKTKEVIPDVTYTSSKKGGTYNRKDIIKNFVDAKGRIPTDKEWNDIINQLGLKPKK